MDVLVWNPQEKNRSGLTLRKAGTLPMRPGDQIRIQAKLTHPMYAYLLWIDCEGRVAPIYPWRQGRWDLRPEQEQPISELSLPQVLDEAWRLQGGPGMETLVLAAREAPLPAGIDLGHLLAGLGPQTLPQGLALVEFNCGRVVTEAGEPGRGAVRSLDLVETEKVDDPLLQAQQQIAAKLRSHFSLIRAVSFANQGKKGQ